ncbi:FAD-binding oxidoreductase [Microlunatus flavus]|uniref:Glycolate oxidase n=1 Tax=Microlunatus flavus TaxID=1036181 RepID=A0A1H9FKS0_9ACTN|nr:FAD-linked oxidase C-terminal domain-containing protein [Microlunatus flavus]SEQ38512.1 glycolate oxidase [Microlunatus flavus]
MTSPSPTADRLTTSDPGPRTEPVLQALAAALPVEALVTGDAALERYSHDEAEWAPYALPLAVVRPRTAEQVQAVVRVCLEHGTPVVPRGGGTGLSGGANAVPGCVVISLEAMDAVLEIDLLERYAVVQPGVINDQLRAAAAEQGLWYPPDPASAPWSTIGGNVATNAGGVCCVKYGVTRDYVLGLQVVTGTGELVRVGRRTAKGVTGYDLTALLVGSEGTLGVVTEITVRLRPARPPEQTVVGFFSSLVAAGEAVGEVVRSGVTPSALELLDQQCLRAVDDWKQLGLSTDAAVILLGRVDSPGAAGDAEAETVRACFAAAGATWAARSTDPDEAEALFSARRLAYPALERLGPVLTEDVCVPLRAVPTMLARIEEVAARHDVRIANLAHAGDGNLHPLLVTPPGDDAARARAQAAFEEIHAAAIALGGTVTGEHGVGLLKRGGLQAETEPAVVAMYRAVRHALDPHGILNPGKVVE